MLVNKWNETIRSEQNKQEATMTKTNFAVKLTTLIAAGALCFFGFGALTACSGTQQEINDTANPLAGPSAEQTATPEENPDGANVVLDQNTNEEATEPGAVVGEPNVNEEETVVEVPVVDEPVEEHNVTIDSVVAETDAGEPIVDTPAGGIGDAEEVIIG